MLRNMKFDLSEITSVIRERRTVFPEEYTKRIVQKEIIENILTNATWAPNHGKTQPWRFKVFTGKSLTKLGEFQSNLYKENSKPENYSEAKFLKTLNRPLLCSVVIAICMERTQDTKIPEIEEIMAAACAVQNMHLTCTAYGLGAFWNSGAGTYHDHTKNFLGLNHKDKVLGFFYIGYTDAPWPKSHRKPIEYVTEWIQ
jgi:nitroreductase